MELRVGPEIVVNASGMDTRRHSIKTQVPIKTQTRAQWRDHSKVIAGLTVFFDAAISHLSFGRVQIFTDAHFISMGIDTTSYNSNVRPAI